MLESHTKLILIFIFIRLCLLFSTALSEVSDISTASVTSEVVPPKFTQLLKDLECTEGQKIRFECRVIGHPTPAIKWYRENQEIISSTDFQVLAGIIRLFHTNTRM